MVDSFGFRLEGQDMSGWVIGLEAHMCPVGHPGAPRRGSWHGCLRQGGPVVLLNNTLIWSRRAKDPAVLISQNQRGCVGVGA